MIFRDFLTIFIIKIDFVTEMGGFFGGFLGFFWDF